MLVTFVDGELWKVDVFVKSIAQKILDKVTAGDAYTTVHHLLNHYVPGDPLPVSKLVVVAAHAICIGHRENNAGIAGLEVAVIRDGTISLLTPEQEKELQVISDKIHADVQNLLTQAYAYESL
ncbi:MAG: hypothetical protein ABI833_11410 [Acidobacteriota bacterium]